MHPAALFFSLVPTPIVTTMARPIACDIKKKGPFESLEQEVFLNLQRTADALMRDVAELLKPANLSATQYNVLRILRGAAAAGPPCQEAAERMITRDPDMTRLLDRLESRGLITRTRSTEDRRVLLARITESGMKLLKPLDEPLHALHVRQLGHLGKT